MSSNLEQTVRPKIRSNSPAVIGAPSKLTEILSLSLFGQIKAHTKLTTHLLELNGCVQIDAINIKFIPVPLHIASITLATDTAIKFGSLLQLESLQSGAPLTFRLRIFIKRISHREIPQLEAAEFQTVCLLFAA